jgi:hypothetical protein
MNNHFNCFLNVLLQTIWAVRKLRIEMVKFSYEEEEDMEKAPKKIKDLSPFINELKDFFRQIDLNNRDMGESGGMIQSYSTNGIRRELFKTHYESG